MNTLLRRVGIAALLGVLMLKALAIALESKFVFFPSPGEQTNPGSLGIPYEELRLDTADGETLVAWQLNPERPIADVVYFHGNGGNLSVWLPILAALHASGLRVLAVDYRGYGQSTGRPSEAGVYIDAVTVVQHASRTRPSTPSRPLVFWGRSLGGAIAASATRTIKPDGLVIEGGFPDKAAVIRNNPVLRTLNVFASYRFDTVEMLQGFHNPVLVIHGDRDSIVPFTVGRELFEQLGEPKQFVAVPGADHNDVMDRSRLNYWRPVLGFISGLRAS